MSRRQQTEAKLLKALEDVILEQGMKGLGINAVGKKAGVSTELIYRYFDGLPGLLLAWMQQQDFWTQRLHAFTSPESAERTPVELIEAMLRGQVDVLAQNPALAEIRRWELIETSNVGEALAKRRERTARVFVDRLDQLAPEVDLPAHVAVMLASVLYLSLRAKTETHFLGISLRSEDGWDRIWHALREQMGALPEVYRHHALGELERRKDSRTAGEADVLSGNGNKEGEPK